MKQFLRHIFLLVAMFVATASLTAQTYNGDTWYSLYETKEYAVINVVNYYNKDFDIFPPAGGKLSFEAHKETFGWGDLFIEQYVSSSWSSVNDFSLGNKYATYTTSSNINTSATKIRFKVKDGSSLNRTFKNVKLPLAKHILLDNSTAFGTSSITVTDGNLATAEGHTSTNSYQIKLRSFLASGNITMTSSNSEFHFGGGATTVSLGVANNYCASANGSGGCGNGVLGHISTYYKNVYFSPSLQYNTTARSTTITITDGVNTAYVHLTAPVIPTYYFKAEAIAEPTTGGVATAKFVNGANTYSLVAPSVGTNSMSADVTFEATATGNSVFEGWKKPSEDAYYKQGAATYRFVETITSNVLDPRTMASQKTYRAIFSERFTAKIETNDISGLKVGASATAVYSFVNTSADVPSVDENADFHYVITHRPDNTTKSGSADASKVVSFDPNTKQVVGLNSGSATITFVQKQNATHEYVAKSFEVTVEKNAIDAWIVRGDAVLNELIESAFTVTDGLDFNVESKNTDIAQYIEGNKIQTYFTEGTAQFIVTRDEDYKYVRLTKEFDFVVKESEEICNVSPVVSLTVEYKDWYWETAVFSSDVVLTGDGDVLTFDYALGDDANAKHYVSVYYSLKESGDEFSIIEGSTRETTTNTPKSSGNISIPSGTKRIRFARTSGDWGLQDMKVSNIYITRKKELNHQVAGGVLVLPQTNINQQSQKSFNLKWSTCADEIKLVSNSELFEVNRTRIDATNGGGTNTIQVTFKGASTAGVYEAKIYIYDQTQVKELEVTCEVKEKLATEIIYSGETEYADEGRCIENMFSVKDENGAVVVEAAIVLTSSNPDILEVCGNAGFMPHCGGTVTLTATYAGDGTHESCSLSVALTVPYCQREIVWNTSYLDFAVDANGFIDEKRVLDATINPESEMTYQLHAVTSTPFAEIVEENGKHFVRVFGEGHGYIVAIANECLYEGQRYDATYKIKELRVSGAGACDPNSLLIWGDGDTEPFVYKYSTNSSEKTRIYNITGLPADKMTFGAHAASSSYENRLVISFSTESEGDNWIGEYKQTVVSGSSYNWNYSCPVPEGAKRVRFQSEATLTIYFNGVTIPQQTYIRPSVESIEISDAIVNEPFAPITFSVDYSNVRLLQWKVSNNHDLGLKVLANQEVNNDCNMHGTYTFTLTGESPYPQDVTETITFYTSAGDEVKIPVTITATLSEPFYFNVTENGDWKESSNWTYQDKTDHGMLPDKRFPIVVSKAMTINEGELVAYGVTIENGGSVNIQPKGGLTLHAGGFTNVTENNFEVQNNKEGVGYVRVSPYFTREVEGEMPDITVQYTTRAKAGGAKDQVWQYVGAPGNNMRMSNDGVMVYLWSERDGWVYSNTDMTPFEGYALTRTAEGAEIYSIVAQPIHDNQTINLTKTANGMNGDNLFVNSYLAPIDLTKFTTDGEDSDFTGNVEKTFYLFNSGSWNDWQGKDGEGANQIIRGESAGKYHAITPLGAALIDPNKDQTTIPPMQGVYVVANGEAQIHLKYNKHVFTSASCDMNRPMRAPQIKDENFMRVRMQVNSQNSGADRMYVIQYANTTRGYDNGYDAKNIIAQGQANIYTNEPEGQMEISIADQIDSTFIGFAAGEDSEYTLTFTSLVGQDMYLHDIEADSLFLLVEDEQYTFKARPNSVNDMRFQLLLYPDLFDDKPGSGVTTGVDNLVSSAHVWVSDKRVYITDAPQNSNLVVYTANGMCITSPLTIHHTPCTIDLSHLPTGVYVLRLNNQAYKFVCK